MSETYEEAKEKSKTCRVQSGKRRSIGPCEVPFKDFKVQLPETEVIKGERKATKDGKASAVKRDVKQVLKKQSQNIAERIKGKLADKDGIDESPDDPPTKRAKLDENGKDKGTKANCGDGVNKKDQDNSNKSSCSSSTSDSSDDDAEDKNDQDVQKDEDDQSDEGDQKDEDDQNDEGDQKDEDDQNGEGDQKDEDAEKDQDDQNNKVDISLELCKSCFSVNKKELSDFRKQSKEILAKYEKVKKERNELRLEIQNLRIENKNQQKNLQDINIKLNKLPGEIRKSASQCWLSDLPKIIVEDSKCESTEIPDGHFYVGGGTVIKRSDLELCADPFTMRGRVAELCNVFWGEECPLYAPSGRREKYGHLIDVKQVPEVHVKAMRIILNTMVWDDQAEASKNTMSSLKEDIRKHTNTRCTAYIADKFPDQYQKIQKEEKEKKKKIPPKSEETVEDAYQSS